MECKKCKSSASVILRKRDFYCEQCFITNTNHKFRSCIGKNRVLSSNEKVLLGVSGGIGSTVLLDLVHDGITLTNHKILRISPICIHILGLTEDIQLDTNNANEVVKQCNNYGFDVYVVHISDYCLNQITLPDKNCLPSLTQGTNNIFTLKKNKMSATEWNDFIIRIKRSIIISLAQALQCSLVFTAETTTTLAINLLSNLGMGRGAQIQHDVGFSDSRDEHVKILRPMKDISKEELENYASIKQITPVSQIEDKKSNSLQGLIRSFVVDLQENFPATISTVCKTSDKIGACSDTSNLTKCDFCQSNIALKEMTLTAREATSFSRAVCFSHPQQQEVFDANSFENIEKQSSYCYACNRNTLITNNKYEEL